MFVSVSRLYRLHAVLKIRLIATDVVRSVVCVSVCQCVGHTGELCKNG